MLFTSLGTAYSHRQTPARSYSDSHRPIITARRSHSYDHRLTTTGNYSEPGVHRPITTGNRSPSDEIHPFHVPNASNNYTQSHTQSQDLDLLYKEAVLNSLTHFLPHLFTCNLIKTRQAFDTFTAPHLHHEPQAIHIFTFISITVLKRSTSSTLLPSRYHKKQTPLPTSLLSEQHQNVQVTPDLATSPIRASSYQ